MEITKENPLGRDKIGSLLLKFAIPSIISMLVGALYNIVDQIFIGQGVGMLGNAATNVAFPLTTITTAIALLLGIGGASNFNLSLGAGNREKAGHFIGNAVSMLVILGVIMCILVRIFLKPLMLAFGATPDILDYSLTYTGITSLGFPFLIFSNGGSHLIRADGSPKYSMFCMLSGAILNTVLDWLFVLEFQWGIAGAAWATVIGQVVSALMAAWYLMHYRSVQLTIQEFRPKWIYVKRIMALGAAQSFNQMAMMVVQVVMNNTLKFYGGASSYGSEIPLACAGIIAKVGMIFFSFVIGLSQGLQPIVSFNYGAKQYKRVRETFFRAEFAATIISIIGFMCFQLFPRQIIGIFGSGSEEYFRFAERYFKIYMFCTFLNGIQPITSNFFTSIGKASRGIFLSLTRQIICLLPLIVIFPMLWGIDGVMYAGPVADSVAAVLSVIFIAVEMKQLKKMESARC